MLNFLYNLIGNIRLPNSFCENGKGGGINPLPVSRSMTTYRPQRNWPSGWNRSLRIAQKNTPPDYNGVVNCVNWLGG